MFLERPNKQVRELRADLLKGYTDGVTPAVIREFVKWIGTKSDLHIVLEDPTTGNWIPVLNPKDVIARFLSESGHA